MALPFALALLEDGSGRFGLGMEVDAMRERKRVVGGEDLTEDVAVVPDGEI